MQRTLLEYMRGLVDKRMDSPKDDLISTLATEQVTPGHIDHDEAVQIAFLLLVAGNATMVNMINLGVVTLLQNPSQLEKFKTDPEGLAPYLVSELSRYHTASAMATRRVAKESYAIGGNSVKEGEGIIAATQSGNRDEVVFGDPNTFDLLRFVPKEKGGRGEDWYQALGFGWGEHRCVGEWLARRELEIAFGKCSERRLFRSLGTNMMTHMWIASLFRKIPNLKLGVPFDQIKWTPPTKDVGIQELPVVW
jgi:nitric oxide reductase